MFILQKRKGIFTKEVSRGRNESFKTLARSPNEIMSSGKRQPDVTCLLKQVHITTDKVFWSKKKKQTIRLSLCLSKNGAIP